MAQELKAEWGRSLPGDLLKRWPRDADGELVPPALLTKCTGVDMDDVLLVNMLEAYGIPCLKTSYQPLQIHGPNLLLFPFVQQYFCKP